MCVRWGSRRFLILLAILISPHTPLLHLVSSIPKRDKITRNGRYFYIADGSKFYIKGVVYQEQGTDANNSSAFITFINPLSNGAVSLCPCHYLPAGTWCQYYPRLQR
ncbi:hypothetical protein M405DRAFT_318534 [Rhizopogon salebrosus TDB-379]|nr:hypothetical protein M405DRAFT_318534 [Rhizopogon salebrosus TDB-379]